MYRLTNDESAELGTFLRTLCRMNLVEEAKHIANMSDAHLSILIQSDKLWRTVQDEGAGVEKIEQKKSVGETRPYAFADRKPA